MREVDARTHTDDPGWGRNSALRVVASERLSFLDSAHVLFIRAGNFSWRGVKKVWT